MFPNSKLYHFRLKDSRWYWKSEALKKRKKFTCEKCGFQDKFLMYIVVHHKFYIEDREPWDYPDDAYQVLCLRCHKNIDHSIVERRKNPHGEEMKEFPFILTKQCYYSSEQEKLPYSKFDDIRYYGRIIDCGYVVRVNQGDGRFDYELILREVMNNETAFSDIIKWYPSEDSFGSILMPKYFI